MSKPFEFMEALYQLAKAESQEVPTIERLITLATSLLIIGKFGMSLSETGVGISRVQKRLIREYNERFETTSS